MTYKPAIHAYRGVLRAIRLAFHGDLEVLMAAKQRVREGFEENRNITDKAQQDEHVKNLNDVSKLLTQNIVQGQRKEDGRYYLNFHDKIELGDNETIKQGNRANLGSLAGKKAQNCSSVKK